MTKNRTEKNPYCSPSTGEYCNVQQYLAEILCLRFFKKEGGDPSFKFWNKEQKDRYKGQVVCISRLITEFGEKAVYKYLIDNKKIYSVGHYHPLKFVKDGISKTKYFLTKEEKSKQIEQKEESTMEIITEEVDLELPQINKTKTLYGKLK